MLRLIMKYLLSSMLGLALLISHAYAQSAASYPNKQVTFILTQAPGGANDITGRAIAQKLTEMLKIPFIVENRPGAGGNIAAQYVAKAPKDGYTLLLALGNTIVINPYLYKNTGFDAQKDFEPVAPIVRAPYVLVTNPLFPPKTVKELITYAQARPGELFYGSAGNGTPNHLLFDLFKYLTKTNIVHVPYKWAAASAMDTVSGQVPMNFSSLPLALPLIKDGRLRALGITSVIRSPLAPEIPPIADTVPGFNPDMWVGILAPAGTPKDIVAKLHSDIQKALNSKDFRDNMAEKGLDIAPTASPAEFTKMIAVESMRWKKIIAESGASIDE